jgi:hypothetical protein
MAWIVGNKSLGDVLQQDNSEAMFRASRFLALPFVDGGPKPIAK